MRFVIYLKIARDGWQAHLTVVVLAQLPALIKPP